MNKYDEEQQILSVKLRELNEDIKFIWTKLMQYDVSELRNVWNGKEMEAYVDKIYAIDKQMNYIFKFTEEISNRIGNMY